MKARITLRKNGRLWDIRFTIGVQTFTIDMHGPRSRKEAEWYRKQLRHALNQLKK